MTCLDLVVFCMFLKCSTQRQQSSMMIQSPTYNQWIHVMYVMSLKLWQMTCWWQCQTQWMINQSLFYRETKRSHGKLIHLMNRSAIHPSHWSIDVIVMHHACENHFRIRNKRGPKTTWTIELFSVIKLIIYNLQVQQRDDIWQTVTLPR